MRLHGLVILACICALAARVHSAAITTQDTIVVTKTDDTAPTSAVAEAEPTTEEPLPPIKLTEMEVRSEVMMRYAHTAVVTRVRNPAKRAQEATFRVLLPETAFISGFVMTLDGKSYKAYVKEKEEAKEIYNQAVSQGVGAAHIAAKARDSNHFTVTVNVEPNTVAVFNLTYEELLVRRNGVYNHAINLHPGALVPKLTVKVHIKERQKIIALRVPEVRTGNEIDATESDAQSSTAVIERSKDEKEAVITFTPDLAEQQKLMETYAEKTKESLSHSSRWYESEDNDKKTEGVLGQFVVQYDVERPKDGEILVNDGYFVHFFAPTSLPPLNKHVVFVLDTSGSMMDRKIVQLREAMQTILSELNSGDYFSIVEFASSVKVHDLKEADQPEPPRHSYYGGWNFENDRASSLVPPSQATPENIAKAKIIVSRLLAAGGTNIASALDVAVDLINKGIGWTQPPTKATQFPSRTTEIVPASKNETPKDDKQEVVKTEDNKTDNKDSDKKLEPIIIFLTDGDPTVGVTDPKVIINRLTEKNYGDNKASIFSLAFGEDADRTFLRKLSLRNDGFMRHIYEAADAALQLRDFYRQVSSPLLADVKFVYPLEQVKEGSLTKHKFRTYYAGSETVVAGRVADSATELTPQLFGFCGVQDSVGRKRYEILPKVPVARQHEPLPLERLWAYLTIKQLLDERDAAEDSDKPKDKENGPEKKALDLALKYEFVTPLTSLVVVKPNATKAVDAESVDKQNGPQSYGAQLSFSFAPGGAAFGPPAAPAGYSSGFSKAALSSAIGLLPASISAQHLLVLDSAPAMEDLEDVDTKGLRTKTAFHRRVPASGLAGAISNYNVRSGSQPYATHYIPSADRIAVNAPESLPGLPGLPMYAGPMDAGGFYPTTPLLFTPPTTDAPGPLEIYHLQDYVWVEPLINKTADVLVLQVNGTAVNLKLFKDTNPDVTGVGSECASATDGAAGVCVYLTHCNAARSITADDYSKTYCLVNNGYAGVCCPKSETQRV